MYRQIRNQPLVYSFIAGETYLDGFLGENGQYRNASAIYVHPNYTGVPSFTDRTQEMNIALLKLSEPFDITDYVRPVCVPPNNYTSFFGGGVAATVTGWGSTVEFGMYIIS